MPDKKRAFTVTIPTREAEASLKAAGGIMPDKKRAFTVTIPTREAEAFLKAAAELDISITLLFRMWIREALMKDPIQFPKGV